MTDKIVHLSVVKSQRESVKPEWQRVFDDGYSLGKDHGKQLERIKNKNFYRAQGWLGGSLFALVIQLLIHFCTR